MAGDLGWPFRSPTICWTGRLRDQTQACGKDAARQAHLSGLLGSKRAADGRTIVPRGREQLAAVGPAAGRLLDLHPSCCNVIGDGTSTRLAPVFIDLGGFSP